MITAVSALVLTLIAGLLYFRHDSHQNQAEAEAASSADRLADFESASFPPGLVGLAEIETQRLSPTFGARHQVSRLLQENVASPRIDAGNLWDVTALQYLDDSLLALGECGRHRAAVGRTRAGTSRRRGSAKMTVMSVSRRWPHGRTPTDRCSWWVGGTVPSTCGTCPTRSTQTNLHPHFPQHGRRFLASPNPPRRFVRAGRLGVRPLRHRDRRRRPTARRSQSPMTTVRWMLRSSSAEP